MTSWFRVVTQSPTDAIACFLDADDDLSLLVLDGTPLRRRPFPSEAKQAVPIQQRVFVSQSVCDVAGAPRRVEVLVEGEWLQLTDALELEVLEMCVDGDMTVSQLIDELERETAGVVEGPDVVDRLRHLYRRRLISFAQRDE